MKRIILLALSFIYLSVQSVSADCGGECGGGGGFSGPGGYSPNVHYFSIPLEDFFGMQGNISLYFQMYQTYLQSLHP